MKEIEHQRDATNEIKKNTVIFIYAKCDAIQNFWGEHCNRSTIFGVWNDCKVYMSSLQVSSDLDLIFKVQCLR